MTKVCLITGGLSGLGHALVQSLNNMMNRRVPPPIGPDVFDRVIILDHNQSTCMSRGAIKCDVRKSNNWHYVSQVLEDNGMEVSGLINCAGVNHISMLETMEEGQWDRVMDTNAKAIYLGARFCLADLIKHKGFILNITSNASHMPMTSSLVYNASKAAAHMMTLQLARELTKRHGITVFGVAPNKLEGTGMSDYIERAVPEVRGWSPEQAKAYQEASLMAGETPPQLVAEFIAGLLKSKECHRHLTGTILPYGA